MGALVLSLVGSVVLGGGLWALIGSRIKLAKDSLQNDVLNFAVYFLAVLVVLFPIIIFVLAL
ncbi:MAG: hypothetical protein F4Z66_04340 [Gammaproteobacteria bacterium]|nr:hypothetical protein [Gammaproteobacteria bacterium]